jgi:hypothetical protein
LDVIGGELLITRIGRSFLDGTERVQFGEFIFNMALAQISHGSAIHRMQLAAGIFEFRRLKIRRGGHPVRGLLPNEKADAHGGAYVTE